MAKRRQRQVADRRLFSDRTAKGLRTLAAPQRVYRDRTGRGVAARRPLDLTYYLSVPPEEMDPDDDNDSLESMIDPSGAIEGARMNSDLYDAYSNPGLPSTEPHIPPATLLQRRIFVICSVLPHDARIGFSFVTHLPMDELRHLQLQRHQPRRSPANRPSGASRPNPELSISPTSSRAGTHPDARATTRVLAPNPIQTARLAQ